ncbi:MAG: PulJ/GspJ family protein [Phycisphaerae bacterium]
MHRRPRSKRRSRRAFTFVELMCSLIIFSLVATAGTYLLATSARTQSYVAGDAAVESEVEFSIQRITENIRAATSVAAGSSSLSITSPPSPRINNNTFAISYSLLGSNLIESYTNNATNASYSSGIIAHNVQSFTVIALPANNNAFQITLTAGSPSTTVSRTFVAFARNL